MAFASLWSAPRARGPGARSRYNEPVKTRTTQSAEDDRAGPGGARVSPWLFRVLQCDRLLAAPSAFRLGGVDLVSLGRGESHAWLESAGPLRRLHLPTSDGRMSS